MHSTRDREGSELRRMTANLACQSDADCPDHSLCYIAGESWSNVTICGCNSYYSFAGENCSESLRGPTGIFLVVDMSFGIFICCVFTFIALNNVIQLFRVARDRWSLVNDPVFLSSFYFSLGGLLMTTYCGMVLSVPLMPLAPVSSSDKGTTQMESIAQYVLSFALMLLAFGIITVSGGFLEMTVVLSAQRRKLVKLFAITYKILFALVIIGLVLARQLFLALIVAFPFIIVLAIAYAAGLHLLTMKIRKYQRAQDARTPVTPTVGGDAALESLKSARRSIIMVCLALSALIAIGIVWCVSSYFVGWRKVSPPDRLSPAVSGAVIWLAAILASWAVTKDISRWRRVRVKRKSNLGGENTSRFGQRKTNPMRPSPFAYGSSTRRSQQKAITEEPDSTDASLGHIPTGSKMFAWSFPSSNEVPSGTEREGKVESSQNGGLNTITEEDPAMMSQVTFDGDPDDQGRSLALI